MTGWSPAKLDAWQRAQDAAHQKELDDAADHDAALERIWKDDEDLLRAVRHADDWEMSILDILESYHRHLVAHRDDP